MLRGKFFARYGAPAVAVVACTFTCLAISQKRLEPKTGTSKTVCLFDREIDPNLKAIVNELFSNKPSRLLGEQVIDSAFYNAIHNAQFTICEDKVWDVVTLPRDPPLVVFDSDFLKLLTQESQTLILGQYLSSEYSNVGTLDLHAALMRHVLELNLKRQAQVATLAQVVNEVVGAPTDISKYLRDEKFSERVQLMALETFHFLILHEFCHIYAGDVQRRQAVESMADSVVAQGTPKEAMRVRIEREADSCAIGIIGRDEARFKSAPTSFISAFLVASTQSVFESIQPPKQGGATHPSPPERLTNAYEMNLKLVEGWPNAARYRVTLDGLYQHFLKITPRKEPS